MGRNSSFGYFFVNKLILMHNAKRDRVGFGVVVRGWVSASRRVG